MRSEATIRSGLSTLHHSSLIPPLAPPSPPFTELRVLSPLKNNPPHPTRFSRFPNKNNHRINRNINKPQFQIPLHLQPNRPRKNPRRSNYPNPLPLLHHNLHFHFLPLRFLQNSQSETTPHGPFLPLLRFLQK